MSPSSRSALSRLPAVIAIALALGLTWNETRAEWRWHLPPHFPPPRVPTDNPMTAAKVDLGRRLFYERHLSENSTQACASCHQQRRAFTDGRQHASGSTGQEHRRNSMSLTNVVYAARLTWANPLVDRLEHQALIPMFGDKPIELGMPDEATLRQRLERQPRYRELFAAAFPGEAEPITVANTTKALAAFERTLISGDSPYDRFVRGDRGALSPSAQRGMALFLSERLECFHCHGGFNFADAVDHANLPEPERAFHNNGLYNLDGKGAYPKVDQGVFEISGEAQDMGRFKAPTLRNVAVTGPYMHDGSIATLADALDHYSLGGRTVGAGPNAGDGSASPLKDRFIVGFILSEQEKSDVLAFLESLTDEGFLNEPRFGDPFEIERAADERG